MTTTERETIMDFYDSVNPEDIPGGAHACLYWDGHYAVSAGGAGWGKRFAAVRWITVLGNWRDCGIADYELGNEVFAVSGALRGWVAGRASIGKRARVYCDRSNLRAVQGELEGLDWLLWVATLDGDALSAGWAPNLWAVQYAGGPAAAYDTSLLYGEW